MCADRAWVSREFVVAFARDRTMCATLSSLFAPCALCYVYVRLIARAFWSEYDECSVCADRAWVSREFVVAFARDRTMCATLGSRFALCALCCVYV